MSSRRLKTIILLMLLAANLCLLAAVLPVYWQRENQRTALTAALDALLTQQGVQFDTAALPEAQTLYVLELSYSADAEFAAVNALLPGARADITSPYQTRWSADTGSAVCAVSGAFSAQLDAPASAAPAELLESMGFSAAASQRSMRALTVWQQVAGVKLLSPLRLTLEDGSVTGLDGCFLFYEGTPLRISLDSCCSAADALVAFLARRDALGWVGEAITGLEQGYVPADVAAVLQLRPVWRIQTDTAMYEVDGLTREVYLVE